MKITEENKGTVKVIRLSGKVISGPDLMEVKTAFESAVNNDYRRILVDLGSVSWMDSSGLGVLVSGHATVSRVAGRMVILNATKKIHELFIITKLITVFDTFNDETEALAALEG
ncbi:MAG: STAS domain-containing protein [Candidatus Fermentibacteraceae bacterium]